MKPSSPKWSCRSDDGFTLLEILIGIAIIAILVALAIPSLNKAVSASRTALCAGNLRQIGLAVIAYANDNSQELPGPQGTQIKLNTNIPRMLADYLGDPTTHPEIWACPSNLGLIQANQSNTPKIASYIANAQLFGYYGAQGLRVPPLTTLAVNALPPSDRYLLRDIDSWNYVAAPAYGGDYPPVHNLGRNVLYLDGHVAWVKSALGQRP